LKNRLSGAVPDVGNVRPDCGAYVLGVVDKRRRLDAPAALADAAFVVPKHREARIRQRVGELAEDGNARDGFVAIGRSRSRDEHDGRQRSLRAFRFRQRSGKPEPVGLDAHVLVVRARDSEPAG